MRGRRITTVLALSMVMVVPTAVQAADMLEVMLVTEDGQLHAYDPASLAFEGEGEEAVISVTSQTLAASDDGTGLVPLGEACADPASSNHVVVGQGGEAPGWTYLEIRGDGVGTLETTAAGHLTPVGIDPSPYGCVFLPDGRLVTSVAGDRDPASRTPSGELIMWWPPFDSDDVPHCKLLTQIGQAGGVALDADGAVLFTAAKYDRRGNTGGVFRLTGELPTDPAACEDVDGVPSAPGMGQFVFLTDAESSTPWDLSPTASGGWFVSNPYTGTITEYDAGGLMIRRAVGNGSSLPGGFIEEFTPYGHALAPNGDLWIAMYGLSDTTTAADGAAQVHVAPLSTRSEPDPSGDRNFFAGSGGKSRITREMNRTQGIALVSLSTAPATQAPPAEPAPAPDSDVAAEAAPDQGALPTTGGGMAMLGLLLVAAASVLRAGASPRARRPVVRAGHWFG